MKENNGMKIKIVDIKEYSSKEVGLLTQTILTELIIIFSIISLLIKEFIPAFYCIIALLMFNLAYNNIKFYKKKYMTSIYIIVGFYVALATLIEYVF